jgi:hypothetical protein
LPVKVLSRLFRRLMLEMLLAAHAAGRLQFFGDHAHLVLIAAVAPVRTAQQPQPPDSAAATDQATHPCPCCGGRMITIETFKRGSTPHHRPTGPIIAVGIDTS